MLFMVKTIDSKNQRIRTVLEVDGKNIVLFIKLRWLGAVQKWYMSVDDENENTLIRNVPLLCGESFPTSNLLRQFGHLAFGSAYAAPLVERPTTENPGKNNLGTDKEYALIWGDTFAE